MLILELFRGWRCSIPLNFKVSSLRIVFWLSNLRVFFFFSFRFVLFCFCFFLVFFVGVCGDVCGCFCLFV